MAARRSTGASAAAAPDLGLAADVAGRLRKNVETVVDGKPDVIATAVAVLLAEGHLLIEDVPGVGKTTLAKALARSMGVDVRRIQFTPDLLPSDVTGVSIYNQESREFEFKPGAVFANVVLGDEINRASPKTQAALLEAMEERQVTHDGVTYELASPFLVVATQNPLEMEGTYPLPEAQRDRFTARISMGYPSPAAELDMLELHGGAGAVSPTDELGAVTDAEEVVAATAAVRTAYVSDDVRRYVVDLVGATRRSGELRLGASPRASLHLLRTARSAAVLAGRDFVLPDDVARVAVPVLAHRLLPTSDALVARRGAEDVVTDLLRSVPVSADRQR